MKLAMVSFAFCGGLYQKKKYFFQTDLTEKQLSEGDFVIVQAPGKNKTTIARFIRFMEVEEGFQYGNKRLLKKAHGNSLKSMVQNRRKHFAAMEMNPKLYDKVRDTFEQYKDLTDEEMHTLILNRLTVAPKQYNGYRKHERYFYDEMYIVVKRDRIVDVWKNGSNGRITWRKPVQLEQYL